jgi:acyl carrier protein
MVFEKLRDILCEQLELEADEVTMQSNIAEDLGADSLDLVDMLMSIEDEFEVEIPDEEIENLKTVGDAVAYIEKNLK